MSRHRISEHTMGLVRKRATPCAITLSPGLAASSRMRRYNHTLRKALTNYSVQRAVQLGIFCLGVPCGGCDAWYLAHPLFGHHGCCSLLAFHASGVGRWIASMRSASCSVWESRSQPKRIQQPPSRQRRTAQRRDCERTRRDCS